MVTFILVYVLVNLILAVFTIVAVVGSFSWEQTWVLLLMTIFTPIPIVIVASYLNHRTEEKVRCAKRAKMQKELRKLTER